MAKVNALHDEGYIEGWEPGPKPDVAFRVGTGDECYVTVYRTYVCRFDGTVVRYREKCTEERKCPRCSLKWAGREAEAASVRLETFMKRYHKLPPRHIIVSSQEMQECPPETPDAIAKAREAVRGILRGLGVVGGLLIFHGLRHRRLGDQDFEWFPGPHFHVMAYGRVDNLQPRAGWVVKTLRPGQTTIVGTLAYLLNHCSTSARGHALTWFGCLSYRTFKCPCARVKGTPCPACGTPMEYLGYFIPEDEVPDYLCSLFGESEAKQRNWRAFDV